MDLWEGQNLGEGSQVYGFRAVLYASTLLELLSRGE